MKKQCLCLNCHRKSHGKSQCPMMSLVRQLHSKVLLMSSYPPPPNHWHPYLEKELVWPPFTHSMYSLFSNNICSKWNYPNVLLGHIINAKWVSTGPRKVKIIQEWPQPSSIKNIKSMLGMPSYHRRFVQHFVPTTKLMANLLKKGNFLFGPKQHNSHFQLLSKLWSQHLCWLCWIFSKQFISTS